MNLQTLNKLTIHRSNHWLHLLSIFASIFLFLFTCTTRLFGQTPTTPSTACEGVSVQGLFNNAPNSDSFQGISINGDNTPIKIIKIYNSYWERIEECTGNCNFPFNYETSAGKYFVQIQFYTVDWTWICQTENLEVEVPIGLTPPPSDCGLDILSADFPANVKPGATISIEATVKNNSTATVNNSSIGLYQFIGGNKAPPQVTTPFGETPIGSIAPGATQTFTIIATLPDPFWNVPAYPIGNASLSNNFALLTKENTPINKGYLCNFPIDFAIDYPDGDLALSFENNQGCIDDEGFLLTNLRLSNRGNTTIKAPIFVDLDQNCSFGNPDVVFCFIHVTNARAYFILNEDLSPGQSILIEKPYKLPNTQIDSWTITAFIDALGSAYSDTHPGNNQVTASFTKSPDCGGDAPDCNLVSVEGITNDQIPGIIGSGILVAGTTAPHVIVKIFNNRWESIKDCTDCPLPYSEELPAGDYIVQVQLYDENWGWICQTDNFEVTVPGDGQPIDCINVVGKYQTGLQDTYEGLGVENLNAPIEIVKIYDANWNRVFECFGNCENPTVIPMADLFPGLYRIHVQMYTENWEWLCETNFLEVDIPANALDSRISKNDFMDIALFPNPARDYLVLQTKDLYGQKGRIQILNIFGKQVLEIPSKVFNQATESIDISNFENGLYSINIMAENRRLISKKFVVESWR